MTETEKKIKQMGFIDAYANLEKPSKLALWIRNMELPEHPFGVKGLRIVPTGTTERERRPRTNRQAA